MKLVYTVVLFQLAINLAGSQSSGSPELIKYNSSRELEDRKSIVIFETMFQQKRLEQIDAVNKLLSFKYEQKYKVLSMLLNQTLQAAASSKLIIENSDYIPGSFLPRNDTVKDALYQILDSTALYGEFQLKIPDITDRIMKKHPEWLVLMKWAIGFTNATELYDKKTTEMLYLVAQEMNLIERSPNFVNPYREDYIKKSTMYPESNKVIPKKKGFKPVKGPRLSRARHFEL